MEHVSYLEYTKKYANKFQGTGEHGVGVGKKEYLANELGEGTVELMWWIKRTIDPLNIMNPGKVNRPGCNFGQPFQLTLSAVVSRYTS
jgi:FAD/FMN-containing dehydrogenase